MFRQYSTLLVLLALIGLASAAWAQSPGGQGGRSGAGAGRSGSRPDGMRGAPAAESTLSSGALVQLQLDQLEDDLKLSPTQRAPWNAYADTVQKLADEVARLRFEARTTPPSQATALQQLDQLAMGVRSRMATVDQIVTTANALYAVLTPEQKALADRRLALPVALATGVVPAGMLDGASRGGRGRSP